MPRNSTRFLAAAPVLVAVAALAPAAPAQAAAAGTVMVTPNTGSVTESPMFTEAVASAACPAGFGENVGLQIQQGTGSTLKFGVLAKVIDGGGYDQTEARPRISPNKSFATAWGSTPLDGSYRLVMICGDENSIPAPEVFETAVTVSGGTWTADSVASDATRTTTALTVTPEGHADRGTPVTLTATVDPATAAGTVTFTASGQVLLPPAGSSGAIPVTGGTASVSVSSLAAGTQNLVAVFTPTDPDAFLTSTSATVPYQIVGPTPSPTTSTSPTPSPSTSESPSPTPSESGTPDPTDEPTDDPTDEPTETPSPTVAVPVGDVNADVSSGALPKTGPAAMSMAVGGVVMVAAGAAAMFVTRRSRRNAK